MTTKRKATAAKKAAGEGATQAPDQFTIYRAEVSWRESLRRVEPGLHGTTTGYVKALRVGFRPCAACRKANIQKDLESYSQERNYRYRGGGSAYPYGNLTDPSSSIVQAGL